MATCARSPRPAELAHHIGVDGCLGLLEQLFDEAVEQAGLVRDGAPVAAIGKLLLAGVDFPSEELELQTLASARGWADRISVGNDTVALLRAGTERGWGVAVVCGAGINCIGVAPDGRQARFPALGEITGDWGGGYDVGMAAVSAAAQARTAVARGRASSSRCQRTSASGRRPSSRMPSVQRIPRRDVLELAPLVFAEADSDAVAAGIVDRLAEEVVALARAALTRLDLAESPSRSCSAAGC